MEPVEVEAKILEPSGEGGDEEEYLEGIGFDSCVCEPCDAEEA